MQTHSNWLDPAEELSNVYFMKNIKILNRFGLNKNAEFEEDVKDSLRPHLYSMDNEQILIEIMRLPIDELRILLVSYAQFRVKVDEIKRRLLP